MDPKFYQTKSFATLKKKWYEELKKSGFEDAEKNEIFLKQDSASHGSVGTRTERLGIVDNAKEDYYRFADAFKHTDIFKKHSGKDKLIWELHSNAVGMRDIAKQIKKKDPKETANKDSVNTVVKIMRQEMFKEYGVTTKG